MHTLKDGEHTFAYLGLDDYEKFENDVRAKGLAYFEKSIAGLSVADRYVAMKETRPDIVTDAQVHLYVAQTKAGAASVLDRSLEVQGIDDVRRKEIVGSYDIRNAGNLAATLLGFEVRVPSGRMVVVPVSKGDGKTPFTPTSDTSSESSKTE